MKPRRMVSEDSLIDCSMFLVLLCSQGVVCMHYSNDSRMLDMHHSNPPPPPHSDYSICEYKPTHVLLPPPQLELRSASNRKE